MTVLNIDLETYSSVDLRKCGLYKYVESPDFEILLFGYSIDGGPVKVVDMKTTYPHPERSQLEISKDIPEDIYKAIWNPAIKKKAFNAQFEITCLSKHLNEQIPVNQWECTSVKASMLGLPLSLAKVASVLNLQQQKASTGGALIRYFTMPCKPTKANGQRTRNLPQHAPDKWKQFIEYNRQDVVTEMAIVDKIKWFEIPAFEAELWQLDQKINSTGVRVDKKFIYNAIKFDQEFKERLTAEAIKITGLVNPNSQARLKDWLTEEMDEEITSLTKKAIPVLLSKTDSDTVKRVLELRQQLSKTSIKKYVTMARAILTNGRICGLLQFYGANGTGRWAGRLVQVQNLPKNSMKALDEARKLVSAGELDDFELCFNVSDSLSQLIRTAFTAAPGNRLIVSDFSAIEARVIAWLAGEQWRLDVFNTHGKIYEASASKMFNVPIESVTKGSDYRFKGKVAELALGYQGGPGALVRMGALDMGLAEDELQPLVDAWRRANPAIVQLWYDCNEAAITAVKERRKVALMYGITFNVEHNILFITLPSGRRLSYLRPKLVTNKFGRDGVAYEGMDQTTGKWGIRETYGGHIVENLCQAIARDCLAVSMIRLNKAGYNIVMHVHDENVADMPVGKGSIEEVDKIMSTPIEWAKGLPLKAESFESFYYKKED